MRAYLIDPIAKTVAGVNIDDADDFNHIRELLDYSDGVHLASTWLNPKNPGDIGGGDRHLGDYCYSGTQFADLDPAEVNDRMLPPLLAECRSMIEGNPKNWFQIDADRPAPATFPVPSRAIVIGITGDGDYTDAEMSLQELKSRVTFMRGWMRGVTMRDDLEEGTTWVGPIILRDMAA